MRSWFVLLICLPLLVACDQDEVIESGEFHGMRIGQPQNEVLTVLRQNGVSHVLPEVDQLITVKPDAIEEFERLTSSAGLQFSDGKHVWMQLQFDGDTLTNIDAGARTNPSEFGIQVGQPKAWVLERLRDALANNRYAVVSNYLPDSRWVHLPTLSEEDVSYLQRYNTWSYHEPNSYSDVVLRFSKGTLERIEYHRRQYEPI
jgi:hypothetical protein